MQVDQAKKKRGISIVRNVFGFIAMSMLLTALGIFIWRTNQLSDYQQTEGTVVSLERARSMSVRNRNNGSYPVVRFELEGRSYQFVGGLATSPPAFDIGEKVPVYYSPANPADAIVGSFWQLWFLPILFGSMGTFFMLPVLLMRFAARRNGVAPNPLR